MKVDNGPEVTLGDGNLSYIELENTVRRNPMDTKKFVLILVAIVGFTAFAITYWQCVTEVQIKRYEQKNFEPLCDYRGGSFTTPKNHYHHYRYPNHFYQHRNRYSRPLPVKTYFKPVYPQRRKIRRHRRRSKRIC